MISFDSVQWRARALFPHYRASISSIVIVVYGPNRVRDITENVRGAVRSMCGRESKGVTAAAHRLALPVG